MFGGVVTLGTFFLDDVSIVDASATVFPECSDSVDNDNDGLIDFPSDPGCTSPADDDEFDFSLPQCSDVIDNDFDGLIDFPSDPGCTDANDDDETDSLPRQCSDGIDNDSDGLVDFPNDPGCSDSGDNDERDPPARGFIDFETLADGTAFSGLGGEFPFDEFGLLGIELRDSDPFIDKTFVRDSNPANTTTAIQGFFVNVSAHLGTDPTSWKLSYLTARARWGLTLQSALRARTILA